MSGRQGSPGNGGGGGGLVRTVVTQVALRSWGSPGVGSHGGQGGMVLKARSGAWPHSRDSSHTGVAVLNGVGTRTVAQQLWCGTLCVGVVGGVWDGCHTVTAVVILVVVRSRVVAG